MNQLAVDFGPFTFRSMLGPSAGTSKRREGDVGIGASHVIRSQAGWVNLGALRNYEWAGNPGTTASFAHPRLGTNSLGMPCPGLDIQNQEIPAILEEATAAGMPVMVNIAGDTPKQYAELAGRIYKITGGKVIIELNCGCPNEWREGKPKAILSRDPEGLALMLEEVEKELGDEAWTIVKLSPFFLEPLPNEVLQFLPDPVTLDTDLPGQIAGVINKCLMVNGVSTINTVPLGLILGDDGSPVITPHVHNPRGLGGLSGPGIKPIGLANVRLLRNLLEEDIVIIGSGGISSGADLKEYLDAGAIAGAVADTYYREGPGCFGRILGEYCELAGINIEAEA